MPAARAVWSLAAPVAAHWPVQRLQWFTKGFYKVGRVRDDVVMTDLRMGVEPDYVFRFKVAEVANPHIVPAPSQQVKAAPAAAAVAAAGLSPLAAFAADAQMDSSVNLALAPWESPTIGFVFTLASCTMSIALVVWGRNGL